MASTNEIIYSIFEKLRPNISSSDDIDLRIIKSELHKQRALFIRNELNRNRTVDPFIIQDLGCVELEIVDLRLLANAPAPFFKYPGTFVNLSTSSSLVI